MEYQRSDQGAAFTYYDELKTHELPPFMDLTYDRMFGTLTGSRGSDWPFFHRIASLPV